MKKRKLALTAGAVALVGVVSVGGTLAYLTSVTETVKNVFTGTNDDLKGEIHEPNYERDIAESYLPGDIIKKDPVLENQSEHEAYVAVKVDYFIDGEAVTYEKFTDGYATIKTYNDNQELIDGFNDNWEEVSSENDVYDFFVYKDVLNGGETTQSIFDAVVVNDKIKQVISTEYTTETVYQEVDSQYPGAVNKNGKYYIEVDSTTIEDETVKYYLEKEDGTLVETDIFSLPQFEVVVTGYMVQADNIDATTAQTELINLLNEQ